MFTLNAIKYINNAPTVGFDKHFEPASYVSIPDILMLIVLTSILGLAIIWLFTYRPIYTKGQFIAHMIIMFVIVQAIFWGFPIYSAMHSSTHAYHINTLTTKNDNVVKEYKLTSDYSNKKEYVYREYNKQGKQIKQYTSTKPIHVADKLYALK